jgi:hypothetical protein
VERHPTLRGKVSQRLLAQPTVAILDAQQVSDH